MKKQVSLKSDKNKSYFTQRPMYSFDNIALLLLCMRSVSHKSCNTKSVHTFRFLFNNFFFSGNHAVQEIMWKTLVKPDRPQMTIQ